MNNTPVPLPQPWPRSPTKQTPPTCPGDLLFKMHTPHWRHAQFLVATTALVWSSVVQYRKQLCSHETDTLLTHLVPLGPNASCGALRSTNAFHYSRENPPTPLVKTHGRRLWLRRQTNNTGILSCRYPGHPNTDPYVSSAMNTIYVHMYHGSAGGQDLSRVSSPNIIRPVRRLTAIIAACSAYRTQPIYPIVFLLTYIRLCTVRERTLT
jgi:hypothetical protein